MKISIIICTFNRSDLLFKCIDSLKPMISGNDNYEVLVVDNNSPDDTKTVVESFYQEFPNLKLHIQQERNLSIARNNGLINTSGDIVAYIDDDVIVDENWKKSLERIITYINPDVFGGPVWPYYIEKKPEWFDYKYELVNCSDSFWFDKQNNPGQIIGANMIYKRSALVELGGFVANFGITPEKLTYGDDTFMIQLAIEKGMKVYYDKDFTLLHYMPAHKMSLPYFYQRFFQLGVAKYALAEKEGNEELFKSEKDALFYINHELEIINKVYHSLLSEIRNNSISGYVETEIIDRVIIEHIYHLGYLVEKSKRITFAKKTIFEKIYTFNIQTAINLIRNIIKR